MPLSYIQSADFFERQLVAARTVRAGPVFTVSNTIDNFASFRFVSDTSSTPGVDNIRIDITIKGVENTHEGVEYRGLFKIDRNANENYIYAVRVNGGTPTPSQLQVIRNNINIIETLNPTSKENNITLIVNRLAIANAQSNTNRRLNINSFDVDLPISETSFSTTRNEQLVTGLTFRIIENELTEQLPILRIYENNQLNTKFLSINLPLIESLQPLRFAKRAFIPYELSIALTKNEINTEAFFAFTKKFDSALYPIRMQITPKFVVSAANSYSLVTKKTYSSVSTYNTGSSLVPHYLAVKYNIGGAETLSPISTQTLQSFVFKDSDNVTQRYTADQYVDASFTLYRHNTLTGATYIDAASQLRVAYKAYVGISNSSANNTANNPADIFKLYFLPADVESAEIEIDPKNVASPKLRIDLRYADIAPDIYTNSPTGRGIAPEVWGVTVDRDRIDAQQYGNYKLEIYWDQTLQTLRFESYAPNNTDETVLIDTFVVYISSEPGSQQITLGEFVSRFNHRTPLDKRVFNFVIDESYDFLKVWQAFNAEFYNNILENKITININLASVGQQGQAQITTAMSHKTSSGDDAGYGSIISSPQNPPRNPIKYFHSTFGAPPINFEFSEEIDLLSNNVATTLGNVIDKIRELPVRKFIDQKVPIFSWWDANTFNDAGTPSMWGSLPFINLFCTSNALRTFNLLRTDDDAIPPNDPSYINVVPNCFLDINETSDKTKSLSLSFSETSIPLSIQNRNVYTSIARLCSDLSNILNTTINENNNQKYFINTQRIDFAVPREIGDLDISQLFLRDAENLTTVSDSVFATPFDNLYLNEYKIKLTDTITTDQYEIEIPIDYTLLQFANTLHNDTQINPYMQTEIAASRLRNLQISSVNSFEVTDISNYVSPEISARIQRIFEYNLEDFDNLGELEIFMNADIGQYVRVTANPDAASFAPINLDITTINLSNNAEAYFRIMDNPAVEDPSYLFTVDFNLVTVDDAAKTNENTNGFGLLDIGVQIAFGGYGKQGSFFAYDAPNSFFEPAINTLFPIEFLTPDADLIYILVRTRKTNTDQVTTYTAVGPCYLGEVTYEGDIPSTEITGIVPTDSKFTSVWTEDFGVPVVFAIPLRTYQNTVSITDRCNLESINLRILNVPSGFAQVSFLAINKNNVNSSQKESKIARSFGLVLDTIGSWDVLIVPNGTIIENDSGTVVYGNKRYNRTVVTTDEAYQMEFFSLQSNLSGKVSLSPLPNNPQIWILNVTPRVKELLLSQTDLTNANSLNGCFANVDIKITGVYSQVSSVVRVKIYRDYTCVYDVGLCDAYWNLTDPPKLPPTAIRTIANTINIEVEELINCENEIDTDGSNVLIDQSLLFKIRSVPTFPNGNALLVLKSSFNESLSSFSMPSADEISELRTKTCNVFARNRILERSINRELLILPNNPVPLFDSAAIQTAINTQPSYLYIRPQYAFPTDDDNMDCGDNQVTLAAIGYQFKNWTSVPRDDYIIMSFKYNLSADVDATPRLNLCSRYFYKQQ